MPLDKIVAEMYMWNTWAGISWAWEGMLDGQIGGFGIRPCCVAVRLACLLGMVVRPSGDDGMAVWSCGGREMAIRSSHMDARP